MKHMRVLLLLLVLAAASLSFTSLTFARYTDELAGSDSALIARWNFSARGQDDPTGEFYNKGFTFDLFNQQKIKPMDTGNKYFVFTGGGSDTAIDYDVRMNVDTLGMLTNSTIAKNENVSVYAPFIFKIVLTLPGNDPVVLNPAGTANGWFRAEDIVKRTGGAEVDAEGYFSIYNGSFPVGSTDQVKITVYWQWNTSCYITDIGPYQTRMPNYSEKTAGSNYIPYYQTAYDEFYGPDGLQAQLHAATKNVSDFVAAHGGPTGGSWLHYYPCTANHDLEYSELTDPAQQEAYLQEHNGTVSTDGEVVWGPHGTPCDLNANDGHFTAYNNLVAIENNALNACETSTLKAYDDYDTAAMNALASKDSIKVMFRIIGNQTAPSAEGAATQETALTDSDLPGSSDIVTPAESAEAAGG
jgi:hypothetical protein